MQGKQASSSKSFQVLIAYCSLIFVSVAVISGIHGYLWQSFGSLFLLITFLGLAYPFSAFLLGHGPNAVVFTFPIGYIIHALFLSLIGVVFGLTWINFILYFVAFGLFSFFFYRKYLVTTQIHVWDKTDFWILFLWLFCTVAVLAIPFAHVGLPVNGGFAYRAYFNTDFFRHMAVAADLSNQGIPPENPYFSDTILRYYWFFHIIPAYWKKLFPSFSLDYLMVQFNLVVALMFCATLYVGIRHFTEKTRARLMILPLFLFGGSYEGLYLLFNIYAEKLPWASFREWNVDAILRWLWHAPQVDTLFRSMLYAPQHLIGLSFFILLLLTWKSALSFGQKMSLYILLFTITGFTVIIAGAFIVGCAGMLLAEASRDLRAKWKELIFSAALGIAFLAAYFFIFQMFGTNAGDVKFEINERVLKNIAGYFPLNWGAILIAGFAGIIFRSKKIPVATLLFYLTLCFLFIIFINIDVPGLSEITLKMGFLSYVILLIFAAGFFDDGRFRTSVLSFVLILMLIPAVLTWSMDWYNNQDVTNYKFTSFIPSEDVDVYHWMRKNVEKKATVQNYWLGDEGFLANYVTPTPALGERSVYVGDKVHSRLYQIGQEQINFRERVVSRIFNLDVTGQISALTQRVGIEYLWLTSQDHLKRFEVHLTEPYFKLVRRQGDAQLYKVMRINPTPIDMERQVLAQDDNGAILLEIFYRDGFFNPEVTIEIETGRQMGASAKLELIAQKRISGTFSFTAYSEPYRRQIDVYLNGRRVGGERAKIRGIPVNVKLVLPRGKNIVELREAENYPGKKPPTDEDRKGRIFMIEAVHFTRAAQ